MKKLAIFIILIFLVFFAQAQAQAQRIYLIEIKFNNGRIQFGEVTAKTGYVAPPDKEYEMTNERYWLELVAFDGRILETREFSFHLEIYPEPPSEGRLTTLSQATAVQTLPYYNDGKWLYLYDANYVRLDQKNIGYLAEMCKDGTCQDGESYEDCPSDCPEAGNDDYCNEDKFSSDPDCAGGVSTDNLNKQKNNSTKEDTDDALNWLIFVFGIIFLAVAVGVIVIIKKDRQD